MSTNSNQRNGWFLMLALAMLTFVVGLKLCLKFEKARDMLDLFFGIVIVAASAVNFLRYGLKITRLNGH